MRESRWQELSETTRKIMKDNKLRIDGSKKLIADLHNKDKFKIHYLNLIQAIDLGYVLKNVITIVKFYQSNYLSQYIIKNTNCRNAATSDFEKGYFKAKNNAVFGKVRTRRDRQTDRQADRKTDRQTDRQTDRLPIRISIFLLLLLLSNYQLMEDPRKYKQLEVVTSQKRLRKITAKPTFTGLIVLSNGVVIAKKDPTCIRFYRPLHVASTILERSKGNRPFIRSSVGPSVIIIIIIIITHYSLGHNIAFFYDAKVKMQAEGWHQRCHISDTDSFLLRYVTSTICQHASVLSLFFLFRFLHYA